VGQVCTHDRSTGAKSDESTNDDLSEHGHVLLRTRWISFIKETTSVFTFMPKKTTTTTTATTNTNYKSLEDGSHSASRLNSNPRYPTADDDATTSGFPEPTEAPVGVGDTPASSPIVNRPCVINGGGDAERMRGMLVLECIAAAAAETSPSPRRRSSIYQNKPTVLRTKRAIAHHKCIPFVGSSVPNTTFSGLRAVAGISIRNHQYNAKLPQSGLFDAYLFLFHGDRSP
jgi:hypothetical protein